MIGVQVGERDAVDPPGRGHVDGGRDPDQRPDPAPQHRIGEHADAVDLEQRGRVPEPGDRGR